MNWRKCYGAGTASKETLLTLAILAILEICSCGYKPLHVKRHQLKFNQNSYKIKNINLSSKYKYHIVISIPKGRAALQNSWIVSINSDDQSEILNQEIFNGFECGWGLEYSIPTTDYAYLLAIKKNINSANLILTPKNQSEAGIVGVCLLETEVIK